MRVLVRVARSSPQEWTRMSQRRWAAGTAVPHMDTAAVNKMPFEYVKADLECVASHIEKLVENRKNRVLDHAATYLLKHKGKMLRPAIVALCGYASMPGLDDRCKILHGMTMMDMMRSEKTDMGDLSAHPFNKHLRLAELTELVHTASLIHDDILDESDVRRSQPSLHKVVGVKLAVLAGDYLLARVSTGLCTLGDIRIVQAMSQALEDLVHGEVVQMQGPRDIDTYLHKSFCKTSSLIANSCKSAAILSDPANTEVHDAVFTYGKHLGLAFQIVDDVLDFVSTGEEFGKPVLNDLKTGVVTLPVLLAAQRSPAMVELMEGNFCMEGDIDKAVDIIRETNVIEESRLQAKQQVQIAIEALKVIPDSVAKQSMIDLSDVVLSRRR
ncbi:hypothetical protein DIPPA_70154 [Diplonema papillatum]|nr:hypothetical protein DIPPA_70154 [Diplonema papillatum]